MGFMDQEKQKQKRKTFDSGECSDVLHVIEEIADKATETSILLRRWTDLMAQPDLNQELSD